MTRRYQVPPLVAGTSISNTGSPFARAERTRPALSRFPRGSPSIKSSWRLSGWVPRRPPYLPSLVTLTAYAIHSFPYSLVQWASWKAETRNTSVPDSRTSILQHCWPTGRYGLLRRFVVNFTFHIFRHLLTGGVGVVRQFINFWFMPLPYRVPFQQTCGVFWTLYLSLLNAA